MDAPYSPSALLPTAVVGLEASIESPKTESLLLSLTLPFAPSIHDNPADPDTHSMATQMMRASHRVLQAHAITRSCRRAADGIHLMRM